MRWTGSDGGRRWLAGGGGCKRERESADRECAIVVVCNGNGGGSDCGVSDSGYRESE